MVILYFDGVSFHVGSVIVSNRIRCHNYSDNIEYVTPSVLAEVDMEFQRISQWSLDHLRDTSIELEKNYNQFMQTKPPGLDCEFSSITESTFNTCIVHVLLLCSQFCFYVHVMYVIIRPIARTCTVRIFFFII